MKLLRQWKGHVATRGISETLTCASDSSAFAQDHVKLLRYEKAKVEERWRDICCYMLTTQTPYQPAIVCLAVLFMFRTKSSIWSVRAAKYKEHEAVHAVEGASNATRGTSKSWTQVVQLFCFCSGSSQTLGAWESKGWGALEGQREAVQAVEGPPASRCWPQGHHPSLHQPLLAATLYPYSWGRYVLCCLHSPSGPWRHALLQLHALLSDGGYLLVWSCP